MCSHKNNPHKSKDYSKIWVAIFVITVIAVSALAGAFIYCQNSQQPHPSTSPTPIPTQQPTIAPTVQPTPSQDYPVGFHLSVNPSQVNLGGIVTCSITASPNIAVKIVHNWIVNEVPQQETLDAAVNSNGVGTLQLGVNHAGSNIFFAYYGTPGSWTYSETCIVDVS